MWYVFSLILIAFIAIVVVAGVLITVNKYGGKYILDLDKLPNNSDTVIVLGAGIRVDGNPCDLLADRLYTSAKVFQNHKCKAILLTGDDRDISRNEVKTMRKWLIEKCFKEQIDDKKILLDQEGFSTYDSIYRAKNNFGIKKAIISTNRYHLPRAIYIARKIGIEAYGIPSDLRTYDRMKKYKKRECLAKIKDFIKVNFLKIK